MEAYQLNRLVSKPELLSQADIPALEQLSEEFPYFQAVKVLKACATRSERDIHLAAAYISDRSVLAKLIGSDFQTADPLPELSRVLQSEESLDALSALSVKALDLPLETPQASTPSQQEAVEEVLIEPFEVETYQPDPVWYAEEEPSAIEDIKESRPSDFEPIEYPEPEIIQYPQIEEPTFEEPQWTTEPQPTDEQPPQAAEAPNEPTGETKPDELDFFEPKPAPSRFALDELLSKTDKGFGNRIERQQKLINRFISNPVIPPSEEEVARLEAKEKEDLSEKSSHLTPEMATESLAKFFLKQGKTESAKQIYRFLIEKHPEKADHFLSIIRQIG